MVMLKRKKNQLLLIEDKGKNKCGMPIIELLSKFTKPETKIRLEQPLE